MTHQPTISEELDAIATEPWQRAILDQWTVDALRDELDGGTHMWHVIAAHRGLALQLTYAVLLGHTTIGEYWHAIRLMREAGAERDREISDALAAYERGNYATPIIVSAALHSTEKPASWPIRDELALLEHIALDPETDRSFVEEIEHVIRNVQEGAL